MVRIVFISLILLSFTARAQNEVIKSPLSFFPESRASVLIVGSFHFEYPNLDIHKVEEQNKIDVLEEPKKSEVAELVEYIKKFKPTKIAIEATKEWNGYKKLKEYKNGLHQDKRDERFQLGFRIATDLGLDTIFSIDTTPFSDDLKKNNPEMYNALFKDFDFQSEDPYVKLVTQWLEYQDEIIPKVNLLEYLKHSNSEEYHRLNYGMYFTGDFKLDNFRGADIISIWWYNRNMRMFRNIQKITENENDRILVIIGNGHAAVLRHLIESSPEYEYIEFSSL